MAATTEAREKVWADWTEHCQSYRVSPYLDGSNFEEIARVSLNFCGRLRQGKRGRPVTAGHVATGIGGVAAQMELDSDSRPLHKRGSDKFIAPIAHMLKGFSKADPATEKKLACHPDLPTEACKRAWASTQTEQDKAIGDLIVIVFYYLLRVGEYTTTASRPRKGKRRKAKQTRQFRLKDITFFKFDSAGRLAPLPKNASDEDILAADWATLTISNQKNGQKGDAVHHEAMPGNVLACPVRALGRRYVHIRKHNKSGNAFICSFWDEAGHANVTDKMIRFTVKLTASALNYEQRGIPINRIDTHSLRAGGACALKLSGHDDVEIRKMGRWKPSSQAFLEYIQQQLSTFSKGMAAKMSDIETFTNMEGMAEREDRQQQTIF